MLRLESFPENVAPAFGLPMRAGLNGAAVFLFYFAHKVVPGQFRDVRYDGLVDGDVFP